MHNDRLNPRMTGRHGFTLMEMLVALGIFAIGMVVVATLFPIGAVLQKETVRDAMNQQLVRSADAIIHGKGLSHTKLSYGMSFWPTDTATDDYNNSFRVYSLRDIENIDTTPPAPLPTNSTKIWPGSRPTDHLLETFPIEDRSFPTFTPNPADRELFWVPLVRRRSVLMNIAGWDIFVFILRRETNTSITYPGVLPAAGDLLANPDDLAYVPKVVEHFISINDEGEGIINVVNDLDGDNEPDQIRVGDVVLLDTGVIYRVIDADDTSIQVNARIQPDENGRWPQTLFYGQPGVGMAYSPTVDIRMLSSAIVYED